MHMFGIFVLMFASCIYCRGTSTSSKLAPFRECYGRLHELRSLIPSAVILSLTATATRETKQAILDVLGMKDPYKIEESPEKPNVSYVVEYMQRDKSLCHQFEWLVEEINKNGLSTERTIIYCQTIQQCSHIYSTLKSMIGDTIYAGKLGDNRNVLLEMLHSCSPPANCNLLKYPSKKDDKQPIISRERDVSDSQKQQLEEKLNRYHKSLVAELVRKHANGIIKSQISLPMLIGFSELQISQVLEHCGHLFTLQDVYSFIEIWDIKHAVNILTVIDQVFGDILSPTVENSTECWKMLISKMSYTYHYMIGMMS